MANKRTGTFLRVRVVRTGQEILSQVRVARTMRERTTGLLRCAGLDDDAGLLILQCRSIHTVGMAFAIDAMFLDRTWRVVRVRSSLGPGRLVWPVWQAVAVLETASGVAGRAGVRAGDQLEAEPAVAL